mgnify:CR=1 FL=1
MARIFRAGAAGVIGRSLVPLLRSAGHTIVGTTRTSKGEAYLKSQGVSPLVVDVFERDALQHAVVAASPDVVMHQLTDLAAGIDPNAPEVGSARNARLRREGTQTLLPLPAPLARND